MQAEPTDTAHVYKNVTIDCPPDHIDGHAYNLYMVPKARAFSKQRHMLDINPASRTRKSSVTT